MVGCLLLWDCRYVFTIRCTSLQQLLLHQWVKIAARARNAHKFKLWLSPSLFFSLSLSRCRSSFFSCAFARVLVLFFSSLALNFFFLSHKCVIAFAVHLVWRSWLLTDRRCLILMVECWKGNLLSLLFYSLFPSLSLFSCSTISIGCYRNSKHLHSLNGNSYFSIGVFEPVLCFPTLRETHNKQSEREEKNLVVEPCLHS